MVNKIMKTDEVRNLAERIETAISEAKQARARRARGESTLTSSTEMSRLMQEKHAQEIGPDA